MMSVELLYLLIDNSNISVAEVQEKLKITEVQMRYAIEKINQFLEDNHFSKKILINNNYFFVDETLNILRQKKYDWRQFGIQGSFSFRRLIILLSLMNTPEFLSLDYFVYELKVSKSTIMRDIVKLKKELKKNDLEILYSRKDGYKIDGDELVIRYFAKLIIEELFRKKELMSIFQEYLLISDSEIIEIETNLKNIEYELSLEFTDDQYRYLPYFLNFVINRINKGYELVNNNLDDDIDDVRKLSEFKTIVDIFKLQKMNENEKVYFSLQVLSSNINFKKSMNGKKTKQLFSIIKQCLDIFQLKTGVYFNNEDDILEKLLYHLLPAYYRIKYLSYENVAKEEKEFYKNSILKYEYLSRVVEESFQPLVEFIKRPLPKIEVMYISLIIGANMISQGNNKDRKIKTGIVVCPKGVTYSQLVLSQLINLFPEIYFYEPLSYRIYKNSNIDVDVVFCVGNNHTFEDFYSVEALMTDVEKERLRLNVLNDNFGSNLEIKQKDEIMSQIKKYIPDSDYQFIDNKISKILYSNHESSRKRNNLSNFRLVDFLGNSRIRIVNQVDNYEVAIKLAGEMLLESQAIEEKYIDSVIANHNYKDPYMVLGNGVAIPHSSPKEGVNDIGISLLIIKEGVKFSDNEVVYLVFFLAPINQKQHSQAILDILSISENINIVKEIIDASDEDVVQKLIKKHENEA